jgi:hypothetical protein
MSVLVPPFEAASSPGVPLPASRLAYAGLLPFVVGAVLSWAVRDDARDYVMLGLSAYAGLVVAFLAGIHWGLAMRQGGVLSWGWPACCCSAPTRWTASATRSSAWRPG